MSRLPSLDTPLRAPQGELRRRLSRAEHLQPRRASVEAQLPPRSTPLLARGAIPQRVLGSSELQNRCRADCTGCSLVPRRHSVRSPTAAQCAAATAATAAVNTLCPLRSAVETTATVGSVDLWTGRNAPHLPHARRLAAPSGGGAWRGARRGHSRPAKPPPLAHAFSDTSAGPCGRGIDGTGCGSGSGGRECECECG